MGGGEETSGRASRKSRDFEDEDDTLSRKRRDRHEERPRYSSQSEQRNRKHNSNRGKFWCHEDLHDKSSKDAGMSSARTEEEAQGKDGQARKGTSVIESARQSPVSHPLEDPSTAPSPAATDLGGPANGVLNGGHGFVLKPLQNSSARYTAACNAEPRPKSAKSPQTSPGKGDQRTKRPHSEGRITSARPGKTASAKHAQVPHNRLSFGEELDEEDATPSSSVSLAQSTANRFSTERELRLVSESSMASPFSAFGPEAIFSHGRRPKTLGPMIFGVAQARGPRPYMEDRYTIISSYIPLSFTSQPMPDDIVRSYAAVFDGHNGIKAAEHACARLHTVLAQEPALRTCTGAAAGPWARQDVSSREAQEAADMGHAVKHAFSVVDDEILERARAEQGRDGATALVVLRIGEVLWAAHAGDSRAVLCRGGQAVRLTQDHKPELSVEKARVEAVGGKVNFQRCWRVICPARNGRPASGLAVSRSFGDLDFKEPSRFIECEPDVTRLRATDEDTLVVMASDGLWDVVSDQEACTLAQESLTKSEGKGNSKAAMDARAKLAAEALIEAAAQKGSLDNVTVLVLVLQWN